MSVFLPARRRLLTATVALAAVGALPIARAEAWKFVTNSEGGYRFIPGNPVFANAAIADAGHGFVHALLREWLPLEAGYAAIEHHLAAEKLPMRALAGIELRLPRQLSVDEFAEFNRPYLERLKAWGLLVDGLNPISRTNVAAAIDPPAEPVVYAFSYCAPVNGARKSFVMSGITEGGAAIVAQGDTTAEGMKRKLAYVVGMAGKRLEDLGAGWSDVTHVELYTAFDFGESPLRVLQPLGAAVQRRGVRWHPGRPPVAGLELEFEIRGLAREIVIGG